MRNYETVAAGQTDQVLGGAGGYNDHLQGLICVVTDPANSLVRIKDGDGSAITVLPANVGSGIGTYSVPLGLNAGGGSWKVSTGSGVSVVAVGTFS